jgi:hypothetical protein
LVLASEGDVGIPILGDNPLRMIEISIITIIDIIHEIKIMDYQQNDTKPKVQAQR